MVLVYTNDFSKIPHKNKVFSQFCDKLTLAIVTCDLLWELQEEEGMETIILTKFGVIK